jgi:hypothetical protein
MVKISIHEPMPMSAVSYYRSIGVLSYLPKLNNKIKINIPEQISWSSLIGTDIFYMERPQYEKDLQAMCMAKDFNVKVWVDYDDLLHEIPKYNPAYTPYKNSNLLQNIETVFKTADIITVSTQSIKEYYSKKFNLNNIHIIPNAHNDYQYPFNIVTDTVTSINWRGSNTHRHDLLSVKDALINTSKTSDGWAYTFIGNDTWFVSDEIKNCFTFGEMDIIDYFKFTKELKSAIQIVPLVDNEFNRAKSNIGWLEGTYSGSVTIAPDLIEFKYPGIVNYVDNFVYKLEKAIKSKEYRKEKYLESYEYIKNNLLLSQINNQRLNIIEALLND